jgi:hypothetical protein
MAKIAWLLVSDKSLLFILMTEVLRYTETHIMESLCLHQDETQCGINALNKRKCKGTATPNVGKQKENMLDSGKCEDYLQRS